MRRELTGRIPHRHKVIPKFNVAFLPHLFPVQQTTVPLNGEDGVFLRQSRFSGR